MAITQKRARELLRKFPKRRILVVGDLMLDRFVYGSVERISPEAPVPVVYVTQETSMPGGASNVACNIRTLGGRAAVGGMIGKDAAGVELRWLLTHAGVDVESAMMFAGASTTVKERIIAERQQVVRVDFERAPTWTEKQRDTFLTMLALQLDRADGVILEDYKKGVITQPVADLVMEMAQRRKIPVCLDPNARSTLALSGLTLATPNRKEAFALARMTDPGPRDNPLTDKPLRQVGRLLMDKWNLEHLAITLGAQGMYLMSRGRPPRHAPTRAREVFDVSGAGDTVIATCTMALVAGASFTEAVDLANIAAGVVIGKIGTASCTPDELLAYMRGSRK
ncbi:MAG: carbohydrate kinase [Lentisphaerae bacterium]|jgi:D-beta-D-heptose 7-phosphate kinase/D-beta-D-heptose 1-phosphate adenosyltransferase|nr:carbohydrate kinase [Lentisphaerota bacterium]